jgi:hypothetical protein
MLHRQWGNTRFQRALPVCEQGRRHLPYALRFQAVSPLSLPFFSAYYFLLATVFLALSPFLSSPLLTRNTIADHPVLQTCRARASPRLAL